MTQAKARRQGPDGKIRYAEEEERLNRLFAACFSTPAGTAVLEHLKSITINTAAGPGVQPNELMHREGQRFLVGLINQRIARGHDAG